MDIIGVALVMLLAVMTSGMISRALPLPIPLPLVQIVMGAIIAGVFDHGVRLNPEIFFLLFLPPLLFLDGWRIPKAGVFKDKFAILELAFGLVIFTVVGLGLLISWMIPSMPLPVAFALAAIVSPTDPVAVSAVTRRVPMPGRIMHILEGESLLNDASGLVAFRFAVAAAVTGTFSLTSAALSFVWVAMGGLVIGTGFTWAVALAKNLFSRRYGEDTGPQILLSLLIPFGAYMLAEHLAASGILAAVAAGVTMSYVELSGRSMAATRMERTAVWNTVQFTLNGIVFVLLGEQLPALLDGAVQVVRETGHHNPGWLVIYALAISLALAVLRFGWVWLSLSLGKILASYRGQQAPTVNMRLILATSLAGVRGAITLAGVLTLPLTLTDGTLFPARDLAIFLAAMTIIISLLVATIALPPVLAGLPPVLETADQQQRTLAEEMARQAAIKGIEKTLYDLTKDYPDDSRIFTATAARIIDGFQQQMTGGLEPGVAAELVQRQAVIEAQMRLAAVRASRQELFTLARHGKISDQLAREMVRRLDLQEARLL